MLEKKIVRQRRNSRSLEEKIAAATDNLRKLQDRQKKLNKKEHEKNQKTVIELIKSERLDVVPANHWKKVMPKIRELLLIIEH